MKIRHEEGQSVIVVLVFVVAFSLVLTAALGFASTSVTANRITTAVGRQLEAAETGVEFGIQKVKMGLATVFGSAASQQSVPMPVNDQTVDVIVTQLNASTLSIRPADTGVPDANPDSLALNTPRDYVVVLADGSTRLPFGATWSVTPTGGTVDQGGRFSASLVGCYTVRAQLGNVGATKRVAVGGATCP